MSDIIIGMTLVTCFQCCMLCVLCVYVHMYDVAVYSMKEMNVDVILKALLSRDLVHKVCCC